MTARFTLSRAAGALIALGAFLALPRTALADNEYVNYMRSSTVNYIFVQESVEGEYGRHTPTTTTGNQSQSGGTTATAVTPTVPGGAAAAAASDQGQWWQGVGFDTSIGLEVMKFFQLVAGHTFVNDRWRDDGSTTLTGSRLHAGGRLEFESPVVNLELGGGVTGSSMQYTSSADQGSFYGSGFYYSLGLNYFTSQRVSFCYEAKFSNEHLVKSSGSTDISYIDTSMTSMSLGFRLWLY